MNESVVITGIGSVLPTGTDLKNLWDTILSDKSNIGELESSHIHNVNNLLFGNISEETTKNLKKNIPRDLRRFCSNEMAWSFNASNIAINDSKVDLDTIPVDRRAMFTCHTAHNYPHYPSYSAPLNKSIKDDGVDFKELSYEINENKMGDPFVCIKSLVNSSLGINSIHNQFKGDSAAFSQNESGVTAALKSAILSIKQGYSDLAVVIFSGSEKDLFSIEDKFEQGHFNFKQNSPAAYCPYDDQESGYILGEGSVAFVLESYESAVKRNARIYLKIEGVESHIQKYTALEKQNPYELCFRKIANSCPVKLENLDFVFGQGMGTNAEDLYELDMFKGLFGETTAIPILNTTPATGFISGVSSMVNILVCVLIQKYKTLPKISNLKKPMDLELSLLDEARDIDSFQHAGIFSYDVHGFHSMVLVSDVPITSQGNI